MRTTIAAATGFLALGLVAGFSPESHAAPGPNNYPYCAMSSSSGATICYYSSYAQCSSGHSSCIENPGYVGPANDGSATPHWRRR